MKHIYSFIDSAIPFFTILSSLLGILVIVLGLVAFGIHLYTRILRNWSPKGWYHSAVLLISDLARGVKGVKWETFHAAKVVALLSGLREQNPDLYFSVLRQLPGISAVASPQKSERRMGRN
jgi:hypothetical protein